MPVPGGTTLKRLNACFPISGTHNVRGCAPFPGARFLQCLIITKTIDGHRVVNDQVDGESGLTFAVSPPRRLTASRMPPDQQRQVRR